MENPADYQYDINVAEVAGFGVVAVWSVLGCLILPLMYYAAIEASKFDGGVSDSGEGRWTVHAAVDLGVPTPVISTALFERFNSRRLENLQIVSLTECVINGMQINLLDL